MSTKSINPKIKVLYISPFSRMGGGEISLLTLLRHIDLNTFVPRVICYEEGDLPRRIRQLGIPCQIIPRRSLWSNAVIVFGVLRYIRAERVSLVHVNSLDLRASAAGFLSGIPRILHLRVIYKFTWRDRLAMRLATVVVAVSSAAVHAICGDNSGLRARCCVVPNAVDVPERGPDTINIRRDYGFPADAVVIGMVGRIEPYKGGMCFVEAAARIKRSVPRARFLIIGHACDEGYAGQIKRAIRETGLDSACVIGGFRDDILPVIAQFDILAVPSLNIARNGRVISEGFGRVAIEAMAFKVPVVASDAGGLKEIVEHGVTGMVFPAGDACSLAQAVVGLLQDKNKAQALAREAFVRFNQRYTIARHITMLERVYTCALAVGRRKAKAGLKSIFLFVYYACRLPVIGMIKLLLPVRRQGIEGPRKIVLIRLDRLGDFIQSLPVIDNLKLAYPRSRIDVVVENTIAEFARMTAGVDRVIVYRGVVSTGRMLRREKYDVAIDMLYDYRLLPAALAYVSGAPARVGFSAGGRGVLFSHRVSGTGACDDIVDIHLKLLKPLGVAAVVRKPHIRSGTTAVSLNRLFVIHPGAYYASQRWPAARFGYLAERIAGEFNADICVVTGPGEEGLASVIAANIRDHRISCISPSLGGMVSLIAQASFFIGNNSGPLHLAAALGVPAVSLMGPTDPVLWWPRAENHKVVRAALACSPCSRGVCRSHACLDTISVDEVFDAVKGCL